MAHSSSAEMSVSPECSVSEDNEVITMVDVLKEEEELEDCTKALLGASDDKNCTYSKGYVKRQALYACVTCIPQDKENLQPGGVCLACSYHCHEGHELIELYTKRNFRCDCGNSKFPGHKCILEPNKARINDQNSYNQNFGGVYCLCKRPYPDPEDDSGDIMIQCIVCEDWYHERDKRKIIKPFAVTDQGCILKDMKSSSENESPQATAFPQDWRKNLCKCERCMDKLSSTNGDPDLVNIITLWTNPGCADMTRKPNPSRYGGNLLSRKPEEGPPNVQLHQSDADSHGVVHHDYAPQVQTITKGISFVVYESNGLSFLLDEQDTVQAYEEKGKANGETQYERGMKALSSMDRVQSIEAIKGYNDMKSQLMEYLQKFAESKKVVREEDIKEFFNGMNARKKQRMDVNVPYFCR
ncbi:Putative E3 ubiquitin-protein ligase UBR7 [Gryllus bimaculatus]|nr:Putative E3 ubiquitin-protein ligase UBR7 [Gryllus bimaculatus]